MKQIITADQSGERADALLPRCISGLTRSAAQRLLETGEEKTIVFGLTGTGYFDMVAYGKFHDGQMTDYVPTNEDLEKGFDYRRITINWNGERHENIGD